MSRPCGGGWRGTNRCFGCARVNESKLVEDQGISPCSETAEIVVAQRGAD